MTKSEVQKTIDNMPPGVTRLLIKLDAGEVVDWDAQEIVLGDDGIQNYSAPIPYSRIVSVSPRIDLYAVSLNWGSDPEFFYKKDGKIVPSKMVVPASGRIVKRDGFQAELNPQTNTCRQVAGLYIYDALCDAIEYGRSVGAEVALSVGCEVDKETFYSLPAEEREFGCRPTKNVHENTKRVKGTRTQFRAGGGHIHMGGSRISHLVEEDVETLVKLMDIVCGATSVLIDRDPMNAERRKYYGRAGEYRKKRYGLEYRVLSNFWLRSYTLWSMVTGLLRNAANIAHNKELAKAVLSRFDMKEVRDAINNNDVRLARKVFNQYREVVKEFGLVFNGGLYYRNIDAFAEWANMKNPIDALDVPTIKESFNDWQKHQEYEGQPGFEWFLEDNFDDETVF